MSDTNTEILNKKNTLAISQQLKQLQEQLFSLEEKMNGLVGTIQTLNSRLNNLETTNLIQKARLIGTGPTVKE
jgi:prefoldin subunit 5